MANITGTWEDREEIRELYARYALMIDEGKYQEWIDCFTEDGVFESSRLGRHEGRAGLRKFSELFAASLDGAQVRHVISNVTFNIEGAYATGACYLIYYQCKDARVQQSAVGHYNDTLRKSGGRWLFASRQVWFDGHH
ncbi:MAG TPA: nuclear transport factor 2 family protein [Candidatus Binataceae bacterium]|nr:nuclear transport factor 2 family protein [Candidatus Binataceae bacterium]